MSVTFRHDTSSWRRGRVALALGLVVVLLTHSLAAVLADASATVYMSVAASGEETDAIASGVAVVYIVLDYEELTGTEVTVRIAGPTGQRLFEHSQVYNGSGRDDIAVTGREIFQAYISSSTNQMQGILDYIDLAQTAESSYAIRSRVQGTQAPIQTLLNSLSRLDDYELSLMDGERLDDAQSALDDLKSASDAIVGGEVPDDALEASVDDLETLAAELKSRLDALFDEVDTDRERPWLDGHYTTNLDRGGGVADDAEWDITSDGTPGTPVASPTTADGTAATATPTPTQTSVRSPTPTQTYTVVVDRPTSTPIPTRPPAVVVQAGATATPVPTQAPVSRDVPTATHPVILLPPTATSQALLAATPVPPTVADQPETAAAYPAPPTGEALEVPTEPPQMAAAVPAREDQAEAVAPPRDEANAAPVAVAKDTPLAPQVIREFPVVRLVALLSALTLGIVALWLRARV